jgi:hypothetical protein
MKMSIDHWEGITCSDEETEANRVEDVEGFIRRLDQDKHTLVCLGEPDKPAIMIGGGKGDYLVTATLDGENWSTMAVGARDQTRKLVVTGGQPGDFHSYVIVTLDQAIAAARYFFLHTALEPSMTWVTYQG